MPYWMEYLLNNTNAYNDFVTWAKGIEKELNAKIKSAIFIDEIDEARYMTHEALVYEKMRQKLESELRERKAQANFNQ